MATQKQANQAREKHSDLLAKLGAHAISVDQVVQKGKKTFAVIAHVESKPDTMPSELEMMDGKKKLKVPLVAEITQKFSLD